MHYQNQTVNAADARLTLTTEVFQAIKVLKYFAWEKKFAEKLTDKREVELRALRKRAIVFTLGAAAECEGIHFPVNFRDPLLTVYTSRSTRLDCACNILVPHQDTASTT